MINGTISSLHNKDGEAAFPITVAKAIYMDDGSTTLEAEVKRIDSQFNDYVNTYPILANETGVIDMRYKYGDVRRFGAKGDGQYDNSTAFENCLKSLGGIWTDLVSTMYIPTGVWKYTRPIKLDRNNITLKGDGIEQTILTPTNCDGIKTYGSTSNSRYGVIVKDFAISGGNIGFDASYLGLNCLVSNISIHSCSGVGYYCKDAFDHKIEYVIARECGGLGFHINQTETTENTTFAEMSYITFNNCIAVNCNNQGTQWSISGNNMYLNNCKANEGSLGIEFVGNVWACRINNFYMDGTGQNAIIFKVNSDSARNITLQNIYGWNVGYVIQATKGRSIIGRNLDVNPGSWEYKALKIDNTYTGIVDLDNKNYVIEDNRTDKQPYIFSGDFAEISGLRMMIKEVEISMYQGGGEFIYSFSGQADLNIQNIFVTPITDTTYKARDNYPNALLTPTIYTETNKEGYFTIKVFCPNVVAEAKKIKVQALIIYKPNKPFQ